jgi:hypothetical protein
LNASKGFEIAVFGSFLTEMLAFVNLKYITRTVASNDELVYSLTRLGGGVGVDTQIFSFSSTLFGSKAQIPAAAKPF